MNRATNATKLRAKASRKTVLVGMLVAAFAALVALGLVGCGPKQVDVPNLERMDQAEAEEALAQAGLTLGTVSEEPGGDMQFGGFVWKQSPEAGTKADEKSAVDIVVSTGPKLTDPVAVPDLTGKTVEEAEAEIIDRMLIPQPGESKYSDTVEPGRVCEQAPQPDTELMPLEIVTYSVSLGKEQVVVPDVVGKPVAEARTMLANGQLGCDITESYSDTVAKDVVIGQSIGKDTQVDKGAIVTIDISLGPKPPAKVKVPNIISYNLSGARGALDSAGLKYSYSGDEGGTVTSVNPAPGTEVDQGSTVTFKLTAPKKTAPAQKSKKESSSKEPKQQESKQKESKQQEPKVVKNNLSKSEAKAIVKEMESGKVADAEKITLDNVEYWSIDVTIEDGSNVTYLVDPDGNIL